MTKNIGHLTSEIFLLLENLDKEESSKVIASVSTLLGLTIANNNSNGESKGKYKANNGIHVHEHDFSEILNDAKGFFDLKSPQTKGEEFAVAAKFRLDNNLGDSHTKEDLKSIIKNQAKRKFDDGNFNRDIDNAIRQSNFFMTSDKRGAYILSVIGEKYIDALPNRSEAAKARKKKRPIKKQVKK